MTLKLKAKTYLTGQQEKNSEEMQLQLDSKYLKKQTSNSFTEFFPISFYDLWIGPQPDPIQLHQKLALVGKV